MKLLVAVPSKGRSKVAFKYTLRWVQRAGFEVRVFVEPQERQAYIDAACGADGANYEYYLDYKPEQFIDIGESDKGLGYVKDFIKQYAVDNGYDLVFKLDDDILYFIGRGKKPIEEELIGNFQSMVGECRSAFTTYPDVAAIGFPYRHQMHTDQYKTWSGFNFRLQSCYIIRTEYLIGGFSTFEDLAEYVYIRQQGKMTLRYGAMAMKGIEPGKNKGGQQNFDRLEMAKREADELRKLYPALQFKKVDKPWGIEPVLEGEFFGRKKI